MADDGTYVERAQQALLSALDETGGDYSLRRDQQLLDAYTLLVLVKGEDCSAEDVQDAWAVACQRSRPEHPYLIPFADLKDEIAHFGIPFRDAIRSAAKALVSR